MDNRQVTQIGELAYLAGIWDGEGSFMLIRQSGNERLYNAIAAVSTTSDKLRDRIVGILRSIDVNPFVQTYSLKNPRAKRAHRIEIRRYALLARLIDALEPFLCEKLDRAIVLREFIESRISTRRGKDHPYTETNHESYWKLRQLNQRGTSTTLRSAPIPADAGRVKIESGLCGDAESPAEMTGPHA